MSTTPAAAFVEVQFASKMFIFRAPLAELMREPVGIGIAPQEPYARDRVRPLPHDVHFFGRRLSVYRVSSQLFLLLQIADN